MRYIYFAGKDYFSRSLIRIAVVSITCTGIGNQTEAQNSHIPGTSCHDCPVNPLLKSTNPKPQDGNASIATSYTNTACGLNYVLGSVVLEQRSSGLGGPPVGKVQPATIAITGIPACATIDKAFLYIDESGNGPAMTATIKNPAGASANFPMVKIGQDADKCWGSLGYSATYSYRGDVTACIGGNGNYLISGLPVSPAAGPNDVDGATLVIIYTDNNATYTGTMIIADGAHVSIGSDLTDNLTGFTACANAAAANTFLIIADMQQIGNMNINFNSATPNFTYPAASQSWWDCMQTNTAVTSGQTTYSLATDDPSDCYNLVAFGLYFQSSCLTCTVAGGITVTASSTGGCAGGSATANPTGGTAPYTYSWSGTAQTTQTVTGLTAGTYTVVVSDATGCKTGTATVTVAASSMTLSTTQINEKCNSGSVGSATVTAIGTAPYTYSWTPSGGTAATASGLAAGSYTITVSDHSGCTGSSVVTITQPAPVTATTSVVNATCGASDGSATVTPAGGTPGYTYSWTPVGAVTATANGLPAGTYNCTVTDAQGCSVVTPSVVGNTAGPTVTQGAVVPCTCFGACNGSATANATGGTGALTYSWTPSGGAAATATALCAGSYTCNVNDANGCTQAVVITITQPASIQVTIPSSSNVLCHGGATGTATASGSGGAGALTYAWTPTGGNAAIATNLVSGLYTVIATDANGCSQKDTITISQPAALAVNAAGVSTSCHNKCDGQLICIPSGGTTPYTYSWATGCTAPSCNNVCAGTDSLKVTDAHGCIVRDTATVKQPAALNITMNSTAAFCNKNNGSACAVITGGTGADTYSWLPAAPGSVTSCYNNIIPGSYTVFVHDANNCPDSNSIIVANIPGVGLTIPASTDPSCNLGTNGTAGAVAAGGTPPYTYSWMPAPGTGQNTANAGGLSAGTYTCTVLDSAGCSAIASISIVQPSVVTVTPMAASTLCIGQCTVLTASGVGGTPGYTYVWTHNGTAVTSPVCPVTSTTYTVVAIDTNSCNSLPANVLITVNPALGVVAGPGPSVCPGFSDTLKAFATGGSGIYNYTWIPALGLSSSTVANPVTTPPATTTYTVIVSDNCGTPADSARITVTVYPDPVLVFAANDTAGCAPLCVSFISSSNPVCASSAWNFGDGSVASGCTGINHCYTTPGMYTVSQNITDVNGCQTALSLNNYIDVWPLPHAAFTMGPQPTTIVTPLITFNDLSSGTGGIASWAWSFGDIPDGTSTIQNPQHAYMDTGCYTVRLIVTNHFGCTDTTTNPVCILPDFVFYAPNAFTPNGDGVNDTWTPLGTGIDPSSYHLYVYDRWGNLLWETRTWGQAWDGRANGGSAIAQIDTYVWKCEVQDYTGNAHKYAGQCSIIK